MFTFKFYLKPTSRSIQLRLTNNRKKTEWSLGYEATEEQLEDALSENSKKSNFYLHSALMAMKSKINEIQLDLLRDGNQNMDVKEIRKIVMCRLSTDVAVRAIKEEDKPDESKLFGKFFERFASSKSSRGYKETCEYTINKIKAFCTETNTDYDNLTFEDISFRWLTDFDAWMENGGSAKNSRNIHFRNIRTVINRAIDEELTDKYPFRRFKIKNEQTRKRSLSVEDLRTLFNYPVEDWQKLYLDMFKLMFMLCGINAIDLYNLTEIINGRIEYRRAKTHKLYSIKVEPEAMEIINRYKGEKKLLCLADKWRDHRYFFKDMNAALKKIGSWKRLPGRGGKIEVDALFPTISSYWARHSFATVAYELDVPKDIISQALGHNSGLDVTETYIRRDEKKVDEANRKVIDYVLYGDKKKKNRPK